ncbi:chromate efflux transporter [Sphingomonas sp. PL-96]|uniref:chromate efflux transporter n=1 Tax=Sphingomonas sp. PL-96 TaxID=2887201 RepID=UPI00226CEB06|nr:chromate efflux transporter [Sphingomonas sp. PL-96]MCC2976439.1 chromate efflux transporter [Sphingomonas sp. PL-96]
MVHTTASRPTVIGLPQLFAKFLRFGLLAFGGPVAQIAMIRQALVEEEGWITSSRFNRLLAVLQVLPGPEAHELCVHMGMVARGRLGGLLAGLGFMLPGLVLMLLCAWGYAAFIAGNGQLAGMLLGVQAAVLAIILRAVHRIGTHVLVDRALVGLAVLGLIGTLVGVPFWVLLLAAGAAYACLRNSAAIWGLVALVAFAAWVTIRTGGAVEVASVNSATASASIAALFVAGLKGGLLTFGGAYTAIPYVRGDTAGRGWLSDGAFLDGVALAGLLPAPLVIFATFAGYLAGGLAGALAITAGMFLPAFAFSLIFFERLEALVDNPTFHRVLDGVAAMVVGIIAATFLELGASTLDRAPRLLPVAGIFVLAALVSWRLKRSWTPAALVVAGGAAGWLALS